MLNSLASTTTLNNGVAMPWFGLGVFETKPGSQVENAVRWALETGYRSIDTAAAYNNEKGVGKAIRDSGVAREDIFVTTKVWNEDQRQRRVAAAFEDSLNLLGLDYVDLYLIHWPVARHYKETWRVMQEIYESGRAKAIGVSNFMRPHLDDLLQEARIVPAVNQFEMHPYLQQPELVTFCREQGIQVEAYSPIMKGEARKVPELKQLGQTYGKTAIQVTLRWLMQRQVVVIPKSSKKKRIRENAQVFDFELSQEDMALIDGLDRDERFGSDPFNFNF